MGRTDDISKNATMIDIIIIVVCLSKTKQQVSKRMKDTHSLIGI